MGVTIERDRIKLTQSDMEEIEIFKNVESPTGERIKLFVDELEPFVESSPLEPPLDLPKHQRYHSPQYGVDIDFDNLDLGSEFEYE